MTTFLKRSFVVGLLLACALASAPAKAGHLEAGTFYLEPKVGFYGNSNDRISSMFTYGGELGWFLADGLSLGLEGLGYVITQKRNPWWSGNGNYETVSAFSPIGILRWHFYTSERFNVFAGAGLGGFFSQVRVPRNGYYNNFTGIVEAGMSMALNDNMSLALAGRWQHIGEFSSSKGSDNWGGNVSFRYSF